MKRSTPWGVIALCLVLRLFDENQRLFPWIFKFVFLKTGLYVFYKPVVCFNLGARLRALFCVTCTCEWLRRFRDNECGGFVSRVEPLFLSSTARYLDFFWREGTWSYYFFTYDMVPVLKTRGLSPTWTRTRSNIFKDHFDQTPLYYRNIAFNCYSQARSSVPPPPPPPGPRQPPKIPLKNRLFEKRIR